MVYNKKLCVNCDVCLLAKSFTLAVYVNGGVSQTTSWSHHTHIASRNAQMGW